MRQLDQRSCAGISLKISDFPNVFLHRNKNYLKMMEIWAVAAPLSGENSVKYELGTDRWRNDVIFHDPSNPSCSFSKLLHLQRALYSKWPYFTLPGAWTKPLIQKSTPIVFIHKIHFHPWFPLPLHLELSLKVSYFGWAFFGFILHFASLTSRLSSGSNYPRNSMSTRYFNRYHILFRISHGAIIHKLYFVLNVAFMQPLYAFSGRKVTK